MLIDLLELASNNALEYDPAAKARLNKLQGKTMTLEIRPLGQKVSISPQPQGLEFSTDDSDTDVTLSATIGALIKIGRDGLDDAELESGELEINGDPIVGQRFARVISDLNIDWEGLLAEHLGETPAVFISQGLGKARELAAGSKTIFSKQIHTLLSEDLGLLAEKSDVDPFLDAVDALRADADRLQSRIQRIQKSI